MRRAISSFHASSTSISMSLVSEIMVELYCNRTSRGNTYAILPVGTHEPDDSCQRQKHDDNIQAVQPLAEPWIFVPVLAQFHADPGEHEAPRPGAHECVDMEPDPGHARDACRQRDESANHRQQASDKNGSRAEAQEEAVGHVKIMAAQQQVVPIFLY